MNIPNALEQSIAKVLREFSKLGEDIQVRSWQALAVDGTVAAGGQREFPLVIVTAAPPSVDDNQRTGRCTISIMAATKDGDDGQHVVISGMYDAVQGTLDRLFSQWLTVQAGGSAGAEYSAFLASLTTLLANIGYTFNFSGFSFGDGLIPRNEDGVNTIGTILIVHYGRSDF
jgi:hypothetical protein